MKKLYKCNVSIDIDFFVLVDEAKGETVDEMVEHYAQQEINDYPLGVEDIYHEEVKIEPGMTHQDWYYNDYEGKIGDLLEETTTIEEGPDDAE